MTFVRRLLLLCVVSGLSAVARRSSAAEPVWRDEWPRFRPWEYGLTAGAAAIAVGARLVVRDPPATWRGGILFDDGVRDVLAVRDEPARVVVAISTHVFAATSVAYNVFDSTIVPGEVHDDWDLAGQMILIDAESYAVMTAILFSTQVFVGRERPIVRRCSDPKVRQSDRACDPQDSQRNRSFIAGHTALGFTAAGLTCAHHTHIPLYGGGAPDTLACAGALGWASLLGVGRVMSDNHYPTDTLLGAALGLAAGWLLPVALHYGFESSAAPATITQPLGASRPVQLFAYAGAF